MTALKMGSWVSVSGRYCHFNSKSCGRLGTKSDELVLPARVDFLKYC